MSKRENSRGQIFDEAELWLQQNDPEYADTKKGWQVASDDALARTAQYDEFVPDSLAGLRPIDPESADGNYRRARESSDESAPAPRGSLGWAVPAPDDEPVPVPELVPGLLARQRGHWRAEVKRLAAAGWSNVRIAKRLRVDEKAVRNVLKSQ